MSGIPMFLSNQEEMNSHAAEAIAQILSQVALDPGNRDFTKYFNDANGEPIKLTVSFHPDMMGMTITVRSKPDGA